MENTSQKLDPEFKAKWVAALRSGKYKQGQNYLMLDHSTGPLYCCLGVAGNLCGVKLKGRAFLISEGFTTEELEQIPSLLTGSVNTNKNIYPLIRMNDDGKSFSEIADYIEANL